MENGTKKVYKAQELRDFADAIAGDLNESGHTSVEYTFDDLIPVIESLRQAADTMDREEKRGTIEGAGENQERTSRPPCEFGSR